MSKKKSVEEAENMNAACESEENIVENASDEPKKAAEENTEDIPDEALAENEESENDLEADNDFSAEIEDDKQAEDSDNDDEILEEDISQEDIDAEISAIDDELKDIESQEKIFEKRRIHMMTKKERLEQKKQGEKVAYVNGVKAQTEEESYREEAKILRAAAKSNPVTRLTGIVVGHRETEHGILLIEVMYGKGEIPIYIPVNQFFAYKEETYAGENRKFLINDLKSRLGSEVSFCVYDVKEKEKYAIGSRLRALESESRYNYLKEKADGQPEIVKGMIAPAKVISVRKDRVRVNVAGADCVIKSPELSWTALDDLRNEFKNGDTFNVKIMEIQEFDFTADNQTYHLIKVEVSKRLAEKNPAEKYFDSFKEGETCLGEVKADANAGLFVRVKNKMDCLCGYPANGHPIRGQNVIVTITSKDEKNKRLYGIINGLL